MNNTTEINKTEEAEKDVEKRNKIEDSWKNVEQSNKTEDADKDIKQSNKTKDADKDIEQNNTTEQVEQRNKTEDGEKGVQPKVTLDTILANEIGQFGRFQWRSIILAGVLAMLISPANFEYVFSTARIRTRCKIPECDSTEPEWSPYWLPNAIPTTDSRIFDNCHRYANASAVLRQVESDVCPSAFFDRNTIQPCDEHVYENTHSVAYDFELACDEWRRGLLGTIRTMGTFTALPITGYVSDRWGRRTALMMNALNTCWMGLLRYWTNTYLGFMLSEFFEAMCGGAYYSANNILLLEVLGPKYRVAGGAVLHSSASFGQMLMALIAWGVPNWRNLTLAVYTPQILLISYFWLLSESVRWYMSKGRFDDAYMQLKKIAKINGRQVSDKSLQALRDSVLEEEKNKALNEEREGQEPWLIVQVFRHKRILVRCLITPVWWITYTFVYHGLTINSVNMSGNRYLNYVATAAVDIPGFWTAFFLMSKMGRKPVLIAAFWMCAACQIAYIFLSSDLQAVSLIVYLISKFSIAMVKFSIFTYTTELYPTKHRHRLFAYSCMIGRIGSILAPLTPAFGAQWFKELPFALFASIALVSGALVFFTPETHNIKLPDTFEEACQIGRKCEANK